MTVLVLIGTFVHQYALNWAFGLNFRLGDMIPAFAVLSLVIFELRRCHVERLRPRDMALLLVPLGAILLAMFIGAYTVRLGWELGVLSYPAVVALMMAAVVEFMAWQRSHAIFSSLAMAYLLVGCWGIGSELHSRGSIRAG